MVVWAVGTPKLCHVYATRCPQDTLWHKSGIVFGYARHQNHDFLYATRCLENTLLPKSDTLLRKSCIMCMGHCVPMSHPYHSNQHDKPHRFLPSPTPSLDLTFSSKEFGAEIIKFQLRRTHVSPGSFESTRQYVSFQTIPNTMFGPQVLLDGSRPTMFSTMCSTRLKCDNV